MYTALQSFGGVKSNLRVFLPAPKPLTGQLVCVVAAAPLPAQVNLGEGQAEIFTTCWKNECVKVHEVVVKRSTFNNTLEKCSWRMDLVTNARDTEGELERATAVVEMSLKPGGVPAGAAPAGQKVRFELSQDDLGSVLSDIEAIKASLAVKT